MQAGKSWGGEEGELSRFVMLNITSKIFLQAGAGQEGEQTAHV